MPRGRRVRRVVRRIDPLSVLKVSIFFYISMVIVLLIGVVILWSLAQGAGAVGKIEEFMDDLGFTDFKFQGGQLFKVCLFGGIVLAIAGTVFTTILAFLYNLIADLIGGVEFQVIEEESVYAPGAVGGPMRRDGKPSKADRGRKGQPPPQARGQQPPPQRRPQQQPVAPGARPPGPPTQQYPAPQQAGAGRPGNV